MSKKVLLIPVLGILGYGLYTLFNKVQGAKSLMIDVNGISVDSVTLPKLNCKAKINFTNPSKENYTVSYIFIDVLASGKKISSIRYETPFSINRETSNNIKSIPFDIDILQISSVASTMPTKLDVTGYIKANNFQIPIDTTINFDSAKYKDKGKEVVKKVGKWFNDSFKEDLKELVNHWKSYNATKFCIYDDVLFQYVSFVRDGIEYGYRWRTLFGGFEQEKDWLNFKKNKQLKPVKTGNTYNELIA